MCGLRLSDRTMRHRTYKLEHRPASLRPTMAAAMVRLAEIKPPHVVLDPMCGAGTILAEHLASLQNGARPRSGGAGRRHRRRGGARRGGQSAPPRPVAPGALGRDRAAAGATRRSIASSPTRRSASSSATPEAIGPLYRRMVREYDRVLRPGGRAVLLTADAGKLRPAAAGGRLEVAAARDRSDSGTDGDDRSLAEARRLR